MLNPNRRMKILWEESAREQREERRAPLAPELSNKPFYVRYLLLIPKNLVYVFILVIVFAFAAMTYIAYTDTDLKDFVKWGSSERKEFIVHDLFKLLQSKVQLDKGKVVEEDANLDSLKFNHEYMTQNRPVVVRDYATSWPATEKWPDLTYLKKQAGFTKAGFFTLNLDEDGIASMYKYRPRRKDVSLSEALSVTQENDLTRAGTDMQQVGDQIAKRKYFISYMDDEPLTPLLRPDFSMPLLHSFLSYQGFGVSLWEQFERAPYMTEHERFICVLDGHEEFRLISPVFRQNLYTGVYDDLEPTMLPEDITFFNIDAEKYPLMEEVSEHILEAELSKGDCLYLPSLYWVQSRTLSKQAMLITFTYEAASKLSNLLFTAIEEGILDA